MYRDTGIQGYRDTGIQGYMNTSVINIVTNPISCKNLNLPEPVI